MNNEEQDQSLYRYPNSSVLRNKFGIQDFEQLDKKERLYVRTRMRDRIPKGKYDLTHLQAIHKHLFQDVYEWAGDIRETNISKGGSFFMPADRIRFAMMDVEKRIKKSDYLKGLRPQSFAKQASHIIGDINHIHPFREGNGRTQLVFLKQLGKKAGHRIDLAQVKKEDWIKGSIQSHHARYDGLEKCIGEMIVPNEREWQQDR
ncbi:MAG: Fic family protein [Bacteroidota bacterium]